MYPGLMPSQIMLQWALSQCLYVLVPVSVQFLEVETNDQNYISVSWILHNAQQHLPSNGHMAVLNKKEVITAMHLEHQLCDQPLPALQLMACVTWWIIQPFKTRVYHLLSELTITYWGESCARYCFKCSHSLLSNYFVIKIPLVSPFTDEELGTGRLHTLSKVI